MTEEKLNIKYIQEKTGLLENDELIPIILEMINECYRKGLKQSRFDKNMLEIEIEELNKQLEEYENHLKISKEMLDLQGQDGNYNYDSYMLGLYNGMEYIISLFETRKPVFKDGKNIEFLSEKVQQQEFIEYLESEKNRLAKECSYHYTDSLDRYRSVNEDIFDEVNKNLQRYKEIIGETDERIKKIN